MKTTSEIKDEIGEKLEECETQLSRRLTKTEVRAFEIGFLAGCESTLRDSQKVLQNVLETIPQPERSAA